MVKIKLLFHESFGRKLKEIAGSPKYKTQAFNALKPSLATQLNFLLIIPAARQKIIRIKFDTILNLLTN